MTEKKKLTWKENQELLRIEEKIIEAEENAQKIEEIFSQPDFYKNHGHKQNAYNNPKFGSCHLLRYTTTSK